MGGFFARVRGRNGGDAHAGIEKVPDRSRGLLITLL